MKETGAPALGKSKPAKSEKKFYSDSEQEEEQEEGSSSEDSSSSSSSSEGLRRVLSEFIHIYEGVLGNQGLFK